jgi:hypothetical protein
LIKEACVSLEAQCLGRASSIERPATALMYTKVEADTDEEVANEDIVKGV